LWLVALPVSSMLSRIARNRHKNSGPHRSLPTRQREFFIDNLLVRILFIIVMVRWTGLAPWELEFPFPGSFTSTFLGPPTRQPAMLTNCGESQSSLFFKIKLCVLRAIRSHTGGINKATRIPWGKTCAREQHTPHVCANFEEKFNPHRIVRENSIPRRWEREFAALQSDINPASLQAYTPGGAAAGADLLFFFTLVTGPSRSLGLKLSDTRVYEPQRGGSARDQLRSSSCVSLFGIITLPSFVHTCGRMRDHAPVVGAAPAARRRAAGIATAAADLSEVGRPSPCGGRA